MRLRGWMGWGWAGAEGGCKARSVAEVGVFVWGITCLAVGLGGRGCAGRMRLGGGNRFVAFLGGLERWREELRSAARLPRSASLR